MGREGKGEKEGRGLPWVPTLMSLGTAPRSKAFRWSMAWGLGLGLGPYKALPLCSILKHLVSGCSESRHEIFIGEKLGLGHDQILVPRHCSLGAIIPT